MQFSGSAKKHIARWKSKGLIDQATASALQQELEAHSGGLSLGGILAILGAILLGAALLTLVAANWEAFPRLGRVVFIFALIWLGYLVGAWRERSGDTAFSQVAYLLGAIAFGGGIALIGQMYHLSGDAASAALVWAVGTLLAAILLKSSALSAMSGVIGLFYLHVAVLDNSWHNTGYVWIAPILALAIAATTKLTRSRFALHSAVWLVIGTLICYRFVDLIFAHDQSVLIDYVCAFGGGALFFAIAYNENKIEQFTTFTGPMLHYVLGLSFFGLWLLQFKSGFGAGTSAIFGLLLLALSVAALIVKGRDHASVRRLAYTAFGAEILYLAFVTVGSLLGTSALFLSIGLVVLVIAFLVIRIEKHLKSAPGSSS